MTFHAKPSPYVGVVGKMNLLLLPALLLLISFNPVISRELTPFETIKAANPNLDIGKEFLYSREADGPDSVPHPIVEYVNASSTNDPSEVPDFIFDKVDYPAVQKVFWANLYERRETLDDLLGLFLQLSLRTHLAMLHYFQSMESRQKHSTRKMGFRY